MQYIEIRVCTTTIATDAVSELLMNHGAAGVAIQDPADADALQRGPQEWDYLDEELIARLKAQDGVWVACYLPCDHQLTARLEGVRHALDALRALQQPDFPVGSLLLRTQQVQEADWANNWKQYYHPIPVSETFTILPVWQEYAARADETVMQLDPGMAFGTGQHATTFLCLQMLESIFSRADAPQQLLDIGCGSGILSIASLLLGATRAVGTDIDSVAVKATRENAALNDIADDRCLPIQGDILSDDSLFQRVLALSPQGQGYPLVVSNIVADIIIRLMPLMRTLLLPGGSWIASGIIDERVADVRQAAAEQGFTLRQTREDKGWFALEFTR